jgi:CRP-like cAMP-binding protein
MEDFSDVRAAFERAAHIPDEEWNWAREKAISTKLDADDFLIREGETVVRLYYVRSGVFRVYYVRGDEEINRSFVTPGRFFTNSLSLLTRTPSHSWVQALKPAELVFIRSGIIAESYDRHPCWERIGRIHAQTRLRTKEMQEHRFRTMSPREHYHWMLENEPDVTENVALYHIASYLRIRAETLSRIRAS